MGKFKIKFYEMKQNVEKSNQIKLSPKKLWKRYKMKQNGIK